MQEKLLQFLVQSFLDRACLCLSSHSNSISIDVFSVDKTKLRYCQTLKNEIHRNIKSKENHLTHWTPQWSWFKDR